MPSVYEPEAFSSRVHYARHRILERQTGGRAFDTCFEMYDGDAVVTALVRKADQEPSLAEAMGAEWLAYCRTVASKYADVPTRKLAALAKKLRE